MNDSDYKKRLELLAELDSSIRKREARQYAKTEIAGAVVSMSLLLIFGFCCGAGMLSYFSNLVK